MIPTTAWLFYSTHNMTINTTEYDFKNPVELEATCPDCGCNGGGRFRLSDGSLTQVFPCDDCDNRRHNTASQEAANTAKTKWLDQIPARQQMAVYGRVSPAYKPALLCRGSIGLIGGTGEGKSSVMALVVMAVPLQPYMWIGMKSLHKLATGAAMGDEDDIRTVKRMHNTPLLCADDLSQVTWSASFASMFWDLLDHRHSSLLATLWTCQVSAASLRAKIAAATTDDALAAAIIRRLCDDTLVLTSL